MAIGAMHERLAVQRNDPPILTVVSITRTTTTATVTTVTAHGFVSTDYVTIAGADQSGYNGKFKVTVTGLTTFTYTVSSSLATPATGTITAIYTSNAQGGQGNDYWRTVDTIWAEMLPISANERLQLEAVQSDVIYRFRVRNRNDLTPEMRVQWTPRWPARATTQTLVINGVIQADASMAYLTLDLAAVSVP